MLAQFRRSSWDFPGFYRNLLGSRKDTKKVEASIIAQGKILTKAQQQQLNPEFNAKEIKEALFSIPDDESPGLDDFSSCFFFKNNWSIIRRGHSEGNEGVF